MTPFDAPLLPPGFAFERLLSRRPGTTVVLARRAGVPLVLRLADEARSEVLAELTVLAAVDHPAVARAVDCGVLPGGVLWAAREWVEGEELGAWAAGRDPRDVGALVAGLAPALAHLHESGFVHGDLKPANVFVRADGTSVLSDFGLARQAGERRDTATPAVAGTPYAIAPELLAGAPPSPASDLFALGVLLHQLLAGERATARDFYARFPAEPFLVAAGTPPESLPDWARDLVEALVATDPAERPESAAAVGGALAARLGLELPRLAPSLRVPVHLGRAADLTAIVGAASRGERVWCGPLDAEECEPLGAELLRTAAVAGEAFRALDLAAPVVRRGNAARLDAWARRAWEREESLLVVLASDDAWARRAVTALARSRPIAGEGDAAPARGLVVVSSDEVSGNAPGDGLTWSVQRPEPLTAPALTRHLAPRFQVDDAARVAELAERAAELAAGSTARAGRVLDHLVASGVLGSDAGRWRFVRRWERGLVVPGIDAPLEPPPVELVELLGALAVAGESDADELISVRRETDGRASDVGRLLARAVREGFARRVGPGRFAPAPGLATALERGAESVPWGALHAARAAALRASDARLSGEAELHAVCAGESSAWESLRAELARLRDRGEAERALVLLDRLAAWAALLVEPGPAERAAEQALAWCAIGSLERAEAALEQAPEPREATDPRQDRERAALERARSRVELLRQRPDAALAHAARAVELDARFAPEASVSRLYLMLELGRPAELLELFTELERDELSAWPRADATNARSLAALARLQLGDGDGARSALGALLGELVDVPGGAPELEATVRLNLATVERRSGNPSVAARELERAVELFDADGRLEGAAQARTALGGALRECGDLVGAEPPLREALGVRERIGDARTAAVTRGTLGLLLAERGHVRGALAELEAAALAFEGPSARRFAPRLVARAEELRARIGLKPTPDRRPPDDVHDPRTLTDWARVSLLRGRRDVAAACIERALHLGERLGLAPVAEEARLLRDVAEGRTPARVDGDDATVLAELAELGDGRSALALAESLEQRGRDDRAARLALGVAARASDESVRLAALPLARRAFERCARGLTQAEALVLRGALLGLPDPCPPDLETPLDAETTDPEFEMEILSLLDINHRLVEQQDLPSLLAAILDSALDVTGAERGFLVLERDGELVFDEAQHAGRGPVAKPEEQVSHSIVRRALNEMRSQRLSNAADDPLLRHAPSVSNLELRSVVCAPFQVADDLRGAIYLDHRVHAAAFGGRAQKLLELLADQAALAIRQVRRFEEIRDLNAQLGERVVRQEADLRTARRSLAEAGLTAPAGGLVGSSDAMRAVRALIERAAPTRLSVLVRGPSGTGKELAARALHELSERASGAFVTENFAALPESLIESELFGYAKGAFTGADQARAGLFEQASGGTIFLDEIGDMPLALQAKLLRVLEVSEVRRLGESRSRSVDFRLVAATNRDLEAMVAEGTFREDLFYRIAGFVVALPTLARRAEDVPELVEHFLRLAELRDGVARRVAPPVMQRLVRRPWPGNVRELRNEIERLCVLSGDVLDDPELVSQPGPRAALTSDGPGWSGGVASMAELEKHAIQGAIEHFGGDKRGAAEALGISLAKLYQRLKAYRDGDVAGAE